MQKQVFSAPQIILPMARPSHFWAQYVFQEQMYPDHPLLAWLAYIHPWLIVATAGRQGPGCALGYVAISGVGGKGVMPGMAHLSLRAGGCLSGLEKPEVSSPSSHPNSYLCGRPTGVRD